MMSSEELYVYLDQNYNVVRRLERAKKKATASALANVTLADTDLGPRAMILFEVSQAEEIKSLTSAPEEFLPVTGPHGGRLIPIFAEDLEKFAGAGTPIVRLNGFRLLGGNSWYIERSVDGYGGFFFKILPDIPFARDKAARAIETTDYINSAQIPDGEFSILPEFLTVSLKSKLFSKRYTIIYRSAKPLHESSDQVRVVPMHGYLGCKECISRLARAAGFKPKEWKRQILIPALARMTAVGHLKLGVSFPAHTQDLLMKIDLQSGRLIKLYFRDLSDVLINPIVRLANQATATRFQRTRFLNMAQQSWIEVNKNYFSEIGYHTAAYTTQAVDSHQTGFSTRAAFNALFVKNYLRSIESLVGRPIEISPRSERILLSLENALENADIELGDKTQLRVRRRNAVAFIIEEIFNRAFKIIVERDLLPRLAFSEDQGRARKKFLAALAVNRVSFVSRETRATLVDPFRQNWFGDKVSSLVRLPLFRELPNSSFRFGTVAREVVAVDRATGAVLGATFSNSCDEYLR